MNYIEDLIKNREIFFNYMKESYPVHLNSNIFLRDILYAIKRFYEKKEIRLKYPDAERLARSFTDLLVEEGHLKKISENTWKMNFSPGIGVISSIGVNT
jgi:hypothetical protein